MFFKKREKIKHIYIILVIKRVTSSKTDRIAGLMIRTLEIIQLPEKHVLHIIYMLGVLYEESSCTISVGQWLPVAIILFIVSYLTNSV